MIHTDGIQTIANHPGRAPELPEDPETPDIVVEREGTIFLVAACTPRAEQWISEFVDPDAQYFGKRLVVEGDYILDLYEGFVAAGFTVV